MKTAVLFFSHERCPEILTKFVVLAEAGALHADFFLVDNGPEDDRPDPGLGLGRYLYLNHQALAKSPGFGKMGRKDFSIVPGNPDLGILAAAERLPGYDYYLYLEPDVEFTGAWPVFFDRLSLSTSDLITSQIRPWEEEPNWMWWESFASPVVLGPGQRVKALNCAMRLSARAIEALNKGYRAGWRGHYEATVPSICLAAGLKVEDFRRPCRQDNVGPAAEDGSLCEALTFRAAPLLEESTALPQQQLVHPVKPGTGHPWWLGLRPLPDSWNAG